MEKIIKLTLGIYETNCFILKENNHVLIIDPGKKAEKIISEISEDEIVDGILLTHGHFDHIGAVDDLVKHYNVDVYMHKNDEILINSPHNKLAGYTGNITSKRNHFSDGINKVKTFMFEVINTPGHTDGSVLIIYKNNMFSGDTIFKGTIGRTDLFCGNDSKMKQSLKLIKTFNPEYIVYPGHGDITTLKDEFLYNPYLI
ncbi:MAG: MBL fold metallo-hydrolase [Erysipelotrichaceae bacterium]|nr:MBL fold metallo-hydrolase [Erysipelotrichaceae bacterium]